MATCTLSTELMVVWTKLYGGLGKKGVYKCIFTDLFTGGFNDDFMQDLGSKPLKFRFWSNQGSFWGDRVYNAPKFRAKTPKVETFEFKAYLN